jgi:phosphoribosylpyrophosphate synthetase
MSVKEEILLLFDEQKELSVKEITERLGSSKQMVHLVMKQFLDAGLVEKLGRTPKTFYRMLPKEKAKESSLPGISAEEHAFLQKHFLRITGSGKLLEGISGFDEWCRKSGKDTLQELKAFRTSRSKHDKLYSSNGLINGIQQLKNTTAYDKVHLDHLFYLDLYAIEHFGKTRIGTFLHFAKQGQNKLLMKKLAEEIRPGLLTFIQKQEADAIAFIPPTLRREVQLMKFIQGELRIPFPVVEVKKLSGIIPIPQFSLQSIEERIANAENTYAVTDRRKFRHLVLIDDEVDSGATLNQVAGKIKSRQIAEKVSGLGIVGRLTGTEQQSGERKPGFTD